MDRQALARLEIAPVRESEVKAAPLGPAQEKLAGILAKVLRIGKVGLNDNFFALGGNSILALGVIARMEEAFGRRIGLREFFRKPTVRDLSAALGTARSDFRLWTCSPFRGRRITHPLPCSGRYG